MAQQHNLKYCKAYLSTLHHNNPVTTLNTKIFELWNVSAIGKH